MNDSMSVNGQTEIMVRNAAVKKFISLKTSKCIKGLAAIIIMLGHYFNSSYSWWFTWLFPGRLWVGVFFFYSGFGIHYGYINKPDYFKGFIKKRILPVYIPFCIAEGIYYIIKWIVSDSEFVFHDFILCVFGISLINEVLWYIVEIIILYFLTFFIYSTIKKDWVWIPLYILFLIISVLFDIGTWWYISTSAFVLGILYDRDKNLVDSLLNKMIIKVIVCIVTVALYAIRVITSVYKISIINVPLNYLITGIDIILVPLFLMMCLSLSWKILVNKALNIIGKISYEVYLYHMAIIMIIRSVIKIDWIAICIAAGITVIFSFLVQYMKEKIISTLQKAQTIK